MAPVGELLAPVGELLAPVGELLAPVGLLMNSAIVDLVYYAVILPCEASHGGLRDRLLHFF